MVAVVAPGDGERRRAPSRDGARTAGCRCSTTSPSCRAWPPPAWRPAPLDPGVVRQRGRGKLNCRERIALLLDDGSFREVGSLAGFASYDADGNISAFTPANHVGGWGTIDERTAVVCADDFTSRGGHADGAIGAKSFHLDRLSMQLLAPSIRLLDGSSGGGSVAAMVPEQQKDGREQRQGELAAPSRPASPASAAAAGRSCPATSASRSTPSS